MRDLLRRRTPDRARAVTFVGNHDMSRNDAVIVYNPGLAQAIILAMSGTPCVYYSDFWRAGAARRAEITRLVRAHDALAVGDEIVRAADRTTLALERRGHLLAVFNSGGDARAHSLTVPTAFGPHVRLVDYAGSGRPVTTDAQGRATVTVGPYEYAYYAPAGRPLAPAHRPLPTAQTWEFADDLDTGRLSPTPQAFPVTLARGDAITAMLALDGGAMGRLEVVAPDGRVLAAGDKAIPPRSITVGGVYRVRAWTADGRKAQGRLTVRYGAPPRPSGTPPHSEMERGQ